MMKNLGTCPKCGSPDGLYVCSFGAVNCASCFQYIRKATLEELGIIKTQDTPPAGQEEK